VEAQDRVDRVGIRPWIAAQPAGDPRRLGPSLELVEVLLATPSAHRHDRDEAPARDEAHDEQPPLKLGHQAGRIGPGGRGMASAMPPYTRRS